MHTHVYTYIDSQSHHTDCQLFLLLLSVRFLRLPLDFFLPLSFPSSISNQHNMLFDVLLLWRAGDALTFHRL